MKFRNPFKKEQIKIGPHLLGRNPNDPDPRDWKMSDHLGVAEPPQKDVIWGDPSEVLNQMNTNHCVGFGNAQWGNTDPVEDRFTDKDGHAIYYEAKVIDGEPKAENGSQVRSGVIALQNRGRLNAYVFADTIDDVRTWVTTKGPVVVGTSWTNDMFNPDSNGYIKPTGDVAGGHCYLLIGYLVNEDAFVFLNSWGESWGQNGRFKMKVNDWTLLFQDGGDAAAAVELPLPTQTQTVLNVAS